MARGLERCSRPGCVRLTQYDTCVAHMTDHHCTPACVADWGASGKAHCAACGENFSTVSNFDKHRRKDACVWPGHREVGLVLNERGLWAQPDTGGFNASRTQGK